MKYVCAYTMNVIFFRNRIVIPLKYDSAGISVYVRFGKLFGINM